MALEDETKKLRYLLNVARQAIQAHCAGESLQPCDELDPPKPVFVSLFTIEENRLRGCIGNLSAQEKTLAREVQRFAISAATKDPRMRSVTAEELPFLRIEISILGEEEPVGAIEELDPQKWGVTVRGEGRVGVLLPSVTGVETSEQQIEIALSKAGIEPHEPYSIFRFGVLKVCE